MVDVGFLITVCTSFVVGGLLAAVALVTVLYKMKPRSTSASPNQSSPSTLSSSPDAMFDGRSKDEIMALLLMELQESHLGGTIGSGGGDDGDDNETRRKRMKKAELKDLYLRLVLSQGENHFVCDLSHEHILPNLVGYDPSSTELDGLHLFQPIKKNTHCVFAKNARVWCAHDDFSIHAMSPSPLHKLHAEGWHKTMAAFSLFSSCCHDIDGFLFHLPPSTTIEQHGDNVNKLLRAMSEWDSSLSRNCMDEMDVDKAGWSYRFCGKKFFITSFSPCYPQNSSRFQFGVDDASFVLFQPISSFLLHGLGNDTPKSATNWNHPTSSRDKTRQSFWKHNRPYFLPELPILMPLVHHIVSPLSLKDKALVWWKKDTPTQSSVSSLEEMEQRRLPKIKNG
eukprot:m.139396 g.139396  ORF g.139396 m.139396 type:complete len:395 (+) comp21409_c0_seq1:44-1228(+)